MYHITFGDAETAVSCITTTIPLYLNRRSDTERSDPEETGGRIYAELQKIKKTTIDNGIT